MTSKDGTLEFQLIPGGGNFTTRWYGSYNEAHTNVFNNQTDTSTYTDDSGIAWSWTIDIPARATITKTAELSAGQVGTKQIIYDANGGTGEMDPTVDIPGESIKLNKNTFTKDDYVFQGWDTNSAGTTVVYADEATLTMPDTDTTLYAVWKENTEITAAAEGFEGAYDGKEHGITVTVTDPSSGATIKYGKTAGTYDLDASPTITNVVDSPLTVYFKVTADGYKDYTGSATVTINKANAVPATVTANNRTYDGAEKSLVTVDNSTLDGGMMQYALGSDATTEPTEGWNTSIPTATDAGTYYVWYKVVGDTNHNDTEPKCVTVNIAQNESESETEKQTESETEKQDPIPSGGGGGSIPQATTPVTIPAETVEEPTKEELQVPASIFLNSGFLVSWSGSKVRVSWGSVPEADHYEIYANYCGNKSCVRVASVSGATSAILKKLNGKKIKTKKFVKAYVIAYKNGVAIGRTILGHAAGPKSAYTNAKAVSVDQSAYQLKAGETAKVSADITKAKRNKKLPGINHGAKLRYASTNEGVATVDGNGVITAVGSGTCEVWIYALNGRSAKVTVNVN